MKKSNKTAIPGTLVDIKGQGCLITGESGIGKSTLALQLIYKGHRHVGDDAIEIEQIDHRLMARAPNDFNQFIEVHPLGFLNLAKLFGESAVTQQTELVLVVHLEKVALSYQSWRLLDKDVPLLALFPDRPCNITLIETAMANLKLQKQGYDAYEDFTQKHQTMLNSKNE